MRFSKVLAAGIFLSAANLALAQAPDYSHIGKTPSKEQVAAWDISVGPDGKGLPEGHGNAKEGAAIFAEKCAVCHGTEGQGGKIGPRVVGGIADTETLTTLHPVRSPGGYWPYATSIWDFIRRAMPRGQSGTLTPNEVYATTAFILFKSNIIKEGDVLDQNTLPKVQMPNRNGFVPANYADIPDEHKRGCKQGICP